MRRNMLARGSAVLVLVGFLAQFSGCATHRSAPVADVTSSGLPAGAIPPAVVVRTSPNLPTPAAPAAFAHGGNRTSGNGTLPAGDFGGLSHTGCRT